MDNKKGIVCFDLDGTLLNNRLDEISASTRKALDLLRPDYYIVISTGRDMYTHYSVAYLDIVKPDAVIHQNGNKITVGETVLFRHTMDMDFLREIYEFCLEKGFCIGTSIGDEDFFIYPEKKAYADSLFRKGFNRNFVPFEEIFERNITVNALSFAGDLKSDKPVIEARFPQLELFSFNKGAGADVVEKGYSKAEGLKRLCEHFGIDEKDTYAFGDSPNDIAILKAAGTGVAVGNADESVKETADYVTDDIEHDGIYNGLKHLGLI